MRFFCFFLFLFCLSFSDIIELKSGNKLFGVVQKIRYKKLYLKTHYSNVIQISLDKISSFKTDKELFYITNDNKQYKAKTALLKGSNIVIGPSKLNISLPKLHLVLASLPKEGQIKQNGNLNIGINKSVGNTQEEGIYINFSQSLKKGNKRIFFNGKHNYVKNKISTIVDKSQFGFKLDYFFLKKYYINNNNKWSRDLLRRLKVRLSNGIALGYNLNSDIKKKRINIELGVSYVNEQYRSSNFNKKYVAVRFFNNYTQEIFDDKIIFFLRNEVLFSTLEIDDLTLDSSVGIRFPFYNKVNATFQVDVDWDNSPANNSISTDVNYLFTLGYAW